MYEEGTCSPHHYYTNNDYTEISVLDDKSRKQNGQGYNSDMR